MTVETDGSDRTGTDNRADGLGESDFNVPGVVEPAISAHP
jgi:hypothetical protein